MARRASGFWLIKSPICPWRTNAVEPAPDEASAKKSCTSRWRTSRPLMR